MNTPTSKGIMKTKEQVEKEFRHDLGVLLEKYSSYPEDGKAGVASFASIEIVSEGSWNLERHHIEVTLPSHYDKDGECIREWTDINLGENIDARDL